MRVEDPEGVRIEGVMIDDDEAVLGKEKGGLYYSTNCRRIVRMLHIQEGALDVLRDLSKIFK